MQEVTKSLLREYHAGRATPLQVKLIEDWLKSPENESLFYQALFEWESEHPQYIVDMTTALTQYRQCLNEAELQPRPQSVVLPSTPGRRLFSPWMVAASALLLVFLGAWLLREPLLYETYTTGFGEIKRFGLADGSNVILNANSTLRVPRFAIGQQDREVFLTGEAEFSVKHTVDHRRFVVRTKRQLNVEVLGTEFVVFARERATRVMLMKGKVQLSYPTPAHARVRPLVLRPGEQATLDAKGRLSIRPESHPKKYNAWKDHLFVFENTSLREVADLIKENYGLNVDIQGTDLAGRIISGSFNADTVDELLAVLKELMRINVVRHKNRVVFSEKSLKP